MVICPVEMMLMAKKWKKIQTNEMKMKLRVIASWVFKGNFQRGIAAQIKSKIWFFLYIQFLWNSFDFGDCACD